MPHAHWPMILRGHTVVFANDKLAKEATRGIPDAQRGRREPKRETRMSLPPDNWVPASTSHPRLRIFVNGKTGGPLRDFVICNKHSVTSNRHPTGATTAHRVAEVLIYLR